MRDLLERWAALEPERCHEVEYGDGTALAVVVEGETLYADSPGRVKVDQAVSRACILAAVIEAVDSRKWTWSLQGPRKRQAEHTGIVYHPKREDGTPWKVRRAGTPAEALLAAYLAALEAEAA